ncbi:MAG: hypothetical protein JOY90_21705 [Bradyrhizobium sp.]|uniref:hypothetical protein n=1 Tax=Bradyrhizobium sp. TaxID=376 RepID=UPI001D761FA9|nr:hypothetical protein [Bradyrhizobium sp.]MBV9563033.1 hypothetical protein [Bradyrhizobium sp.]
MPIGAIGGAESRAQVSLVREAWQPMLAFQKREIRFLERKWQPQLIAAHRQLRSLPMEEAAAAENLRITPVAYE